MAVVEGQGGSSEDDGLDAGVEPAVDLSGDAAAEGGAAALADDAVELAAPVAAVGPPADPVEIAPDAADAPAGDLAGDPGDPAEAVGAVGRGTPVGERSGRVHWFAGRVHEVLDELTGPGLQVATMSGTEVAESVAELLSAASRLQAVAVQLVGQGDRLEVAAAAGATSTAAWLAHTTVVPHQEARRWTRLASRWQDPVFEPTVTAVLAGEVHLDQGEVITAAVDALPATVGGEDRALAQKHLLGEATRHDARRLKVLGRHVWAVLDPDAADAELAKRLAAEERAAAARTFLRVRDDGNGTCSGAFRIPALHGTMLSTALQALASPARPDPIPRTEPDPDPCERLGGVRPRLSCEVLGEAFCQFLERFPTHALPTADGVNATVVVTMGLDTLLGGLQAATLDGGHGGGLGGMGGGHLSAGLSGGLSAGEARRLACQAGIIPAVLGGRSQVLDLGSRRRLFTEGQRVALGLRDRGCTAESCDRPSSWCHAHHDIPWSAGGRTDLSNGRLLCPRHHTLVHTPGYTTHPTAGGKIQITRIRQ